MNYSKEMSPSEVAELQKEVELANSAHIAAELERESALVNSFWKTFEMLARDSEFIFEFIDRCEKYLENMKKLYPNAVNYSVSYHKSKNTFWIEDLRELWWEVHN